jgi:hypothetical protein
MSLSYRNAALNRSQRAVNPAGADRPLVILVDDDDSLRKALRELMLSVGLDAIGFAFTRDLLEAGLPRVGGDSLGAASLRPADWLEGLP